MQYETASRRPGRGLDTVFRVIFLFISFLPQVLAIPHPRYHAVAYATAIEALKQKLQTMEASTATAGFRDRVTRAWQAVRDAGATMIPAKVSQSCARKDKEERKVRRSPASPVGLDCDSELDRGRGCGHLRQSRVFFLFCFSCFLSCDSYDSTAVFLLFFRPLAKASSRRSEVVAVDDVSARGKGIHIWKPCALFDIS